jgi:hypothetical protein
LHFVYHIA